MVRVASFNLNNLFDRFNFFASLPRRANVTATYEWRLDRRLDIVESGIPNFEPGDRDTEIVEGGGPVRVQVGSYGKIVAPKKEQHLRALLQRTDHLNADVLAVQEVENMTALREFNSLLDAEYPYLCLFEGNDPRMIDVGLLSRFPIRRGISHRWFPDDKRPGEFLFSRDLLAVEILDSAHLLTLFTIWIGHFKSKFVDPKITDLVEIKEAQEENDDRRLRQANATFELIAKYHDTKTDRFIVCGDLNDDPGSGPLEPLFNNELGLIDVLGDDPFIDYERPDGTNPRIGSSEDVPPNDNWTHRYRVSGGSDTYGRLDHIFVSRALSDKVDSSGIQRRTHWGLDQAGSDHDPVFVDINLDELDE